MTIVRKHLFITSGLLLGLAMLGSASCCSEAPPVTPSSGTTQSSVTEAQSESGTDLLKSNAGGYLVRYSPKPDPLPVGELCDLEVQVLRANGSPMTTDEVVLFADAAMPHHGHGMNVVPQVTANGGGNFHVDGMLFHMPGRWELYFDITENGVTERAQCVVFFE